MRRSRLLSAAAALLLVPLLQVLPASSAGAAPTASAKAPANDVRELTRKDFKLDGKQVQTAAKYTPTAQTKAKAAAAAASTPAVGTVRQWLGLDDAQGILYRKDYTLRAVGTKIEVWVAN